MIEIDECVTHDSSPLPIRAKIFGPLYRKREKKKRKATSHSNHTDADNLLPKCCWYFAQKHEGHGGKMRRTRRSLPIPQTASKSQLRTPRDADTTSSTQQSAQAPSAKRPSRTENSRQPGSFHSQAYPMRYAASPLAVANQKRSSCDCAVPPTPRPLGF